MNRPNYIRRPTAVLGLAAALLLPLTAAVAAAAPAVAVDTASVVPEPGKLALYGLAAAGVLYRKLRATRD
jgi:hypothetical protein